MSKENRFAPRKDLQWEGVVASVDGTALCRCKMVNISTSGAKLVVEASEKVPDHFVLVLSHNATVRRKCDVMWRSGSSVGVRFRLSPSPEEAAFSFIKDTLARLTPDDQDQK